MSQINVMLVDDHAVVRMGFKMLLESDADIKVIAEAESGEQSIQRYVEHKPDVVVMDLSMPGQGGFERRGIAGTIAAVPGSDRFERQAGNHSRAAGGGVGVGRVRVHACRGPVRVPSHEAWNPGRGWRRVHRAAPGVGWRAR